MQTKLSIGSLAGALSLAVALFAQTGCGAPVSAGSGDAVSNAPSAYTGEALFRGVVLGEGEVATRLPELWSANEAAAEGTRASNDALVASVAQRDPAFFDAFGAKMQSGDPVQVGQALDRASALIGQPESRPQPGCLYALCDIVVQVNRMTAVIVHGDAMAFILPRISQKLGLQRDQAVALLADRLAR